LEILGVEEEGRGGEGEIEGISVELIVQGGYNGGIYF